LRILTRLGALIVGASLIGTLTVPATPASAADRSAKLARHGVAVNPLAVSGKHILIRDGLGAFRISHNQGKT